MNTSLPDQSTFSSNPDSFFQQIDTYNWSTDSEFQSGLRAILGSSNSLPQEQAEQLTLRARCFYFSRKNAVPVDFDAYQEWRRHHRSSSSPSTQSVDNNNPIITRPSDDHSPTPISTQKESASSPPQYSPTKIKETSITPIASPSASASAEPPSTEPPAASAPAPAEEARYPTSFNHIVELIINGQPIPGIKDVPDTVLSGQDSPAATAKRKKPWEA